MLLRRVRRCSRKLPSFLSRRKAKTSLAWRSPARQKVTMADQSERQPANPVFSFQQALDMGVQPADKGHHVARAPMADIKMAVQRKPRLMSFSVGMVEDSSWAVRSRMRYRQAHSARLDQVPGRFSLRLMQGWHAEVLRPVLFVRWRIRLPPSLCNGARRRALLVWRPQGHARPDDKSVVFAGF